MPIRSYLERILRGWPRRPPPEEGLDQELRAYVDLVADERVVSGMAPGEARRTALAEFGGIERVKQAVRDERAGAGLERLFRDLKFGLRQVARNPGFAATIAVTLALAIGANTAVFSLINALLLKDLPYPHPDRLGTIFLTSHGSKFDWQSHAITGEQWELLRDGVPSLLSAVSSTGISGINLRAGAHVEYVHGARVSARYFEALGLRPALGRSFSEAEDRPHGAKAVILSYNLWRNTFGMNPSLLGGSICLKGDSYMVVGVLPQGATTPLDA